MCARRGHKKLHELPKTPGGVAKWPTARGGTYLPPASFPRWRQRRLQPTCGERGGLVDHPVHRVQGVGDGGPATDGAVTDRVAWRAQLDRLARVRGADHDRRRAVVAQEHI